MRKVKVGDIIRVSKGRKATHVTNIKIENALRYIQIEDLRSDNILQYSLDKNGVFVDASDICIAWDGANAGTVGYGLSGIIGSTIARLRLEDKSIYTPYVGRFLQTKFHILNGKTTGTTIPHVERSRLDNLELSLPSFGEQRRIAAILDKADAIRRKRQEALKLADALVKSRFIEMFGDPVTNPMGWERGTIRDITDDVRYGTSKPASDHGKYAYLRMNNITYSGELDLSDLKSIDMPDSEVEKYIVRDGDVLFNRTNSKELVGKTCVFKSDTPMVIAGYIIRLRVNNRATPTYLSAFLNSDYGKLTLRGMCKSIIGQANINAQELQSIKILIPPIALQNHFASFIEQVDKSKFAMQRQLAEAEASKASLMQQFFS
ncbi:restriction endonuclease subunit S [Desulfovibrio sp. SGI.169]|uniref:restriction endonuclease subunit S n=1 Tax=Desulfovibrio sp. SGI.169 TaxID=3420561 RepID=UPI003D08B05C